MAPLGLSDPHPQKSKLALGTDDFRQDDDHMDFGNFCERVERLDDLR
jgi:hypothetical protein